MAVVFLEEGSVANTVAKWRAPYFYYGPGCGICQMRAYLECEDFMHRTQFVAESGLLVLADCEIIKK